MRIYNLSIPRVLHLLNLDTFFEADFAQKVKTKSVCLVLSSDVNLILYVKVGFSRVRVLLKSANTGRALVTPL